MRPLKIKNNKVGKQQKETSSSVTQIVKPLLVGNQEYILKHPLLEEKKSKSINLGY